ncbi:MAG TPA: protein kinase [Vicinamibacteria bacterium]|nr:protein kinase [Vicinamibacteria bacterium]
MSEEKLSHYTILEEIARGEAQVVYRARDDKLNREVALKVLPKVLVQDPERRRRFVAEAKAAAVLEHPHIGVIHEIDDAAGVAFIAMELIRGETLGSRLSRGPIAVVEAIDLAIGIASGIAYAHERGIVHRDVKPANVMLTEGGHPKIIDFGLAKLLDTDRSPFVSECGDEELPLQSSTREGFVTGTASFMSPEQARGGTVDRRSDVFSFGLLLYAMIAGTPPFEGPTRIDTLHAILRDPTPKLPLPPDARALLQPILERCLSKEPDGRYSSMSEVLEELKRARTRLEAPSFGFRGIQRVAAAVALVASGAVAAAMFMSGRGATPPDAHVKPTLAVLQFENLSGDAELDWLRTGLTELLVTDLSQSKDLEVVTTDRLYQILEDMGRRNSGPLTAGDVAELAQRAGAEKVLLGSFAKAGESIRLSARIQKAETGQVLFTETVETSGEANVFRLVDDMTARIKSELGIEGPRGELDRDLREVTTSSVEAYREYAEGIRLHERFREEEAIPHFEAAVELDPGFAMALAKLGVVQSNLGRDEEADANAERALEHIDRLSERERYYIEGWAYSRKPSTLGRAIEAYEKAIELYPDHGSARHNLGNLLFENERYDEAIEQLEELRRRRMLFPATYEQLAAAYVALDEIDSAREVLTEFNALNPDDWTTLVSLAQIEIETDDIEGGLKTLARAEALGASSLRTRPVRWQAQILREQWDEALQTARAMMEATSPIETFLGGQLLSTTLLYRGEVQPVLEALERVAATPPVDGKHLFGSKPLLFKARILLEAGDYASAKEAALAAAPDDRFGQSKEQAVLAAIACEHLGQSEEARQWTRAYEQRANLSLGPADERTFELLQGELAMARGSYGRAITHLNEAESLLPPRGADGMHALIWYSLATAHLRAGNFSEAIGWYERILESTQERMYEPIRYVRSFYFLAGLLEQEGDSDEARAYYERFLEHWEHGDIDRERVREARAKVRRSSSTEAR